MNSRMENYLSDLDAAPRARARAAIRSYVLRQGRMSEGKWQSYQELFPRYAISFVPEACNFSLHFPLEQPLILEIGFGMGHATAEIAEGNPGLNYLGIEVHTPGVVSLLREIDRRGLENLRVIQHDAAEVIHQMLAPGSLQGIHLFFPDPWPKKRHFKRRLIQPDFLELVLTRLVPGGYIYAVTDWEDYALWMRRHFESAGGRAGGLEQRAGEQPWRPRTAFEKKGLDQGHDIYEMYFVKGS